MKKQFLPIELIYQISSLLIAFIIVHGVFVAVIRPKAEDFQHQEAIAMAENREYVQQRNFYVVIKDYEQEACFG